MIKLISEEAVGRYASFDLGSGRGVGIVESINNCTVHISPVDLRDNRITSCCHPSKQGRKIKRHIEKHHVHVHPAGVIPRPTQKRS